MLTASFDTDRSSSAAIHGAVQYDTGQRLKLCGLPGPGEIGCEDERLAGNGETVQVQFAAKKRAKNRLHCLPGRRGNVASAGKRANVEKRGTWRAGAGRPAGNSGGEGRTGRTGAAGRGRRIPRPDADAGRHGRTGECGGRNPPGSGHGRGRAGARDTFGHAAGHQRRDCGPGDALRM